MKEACRPQTLPASSRSLHKCFLGSFCTSLSCRCWLEIREMFLLTCIDCAASGCLSEHYRLNELDWIYFVFRWKFSWFKATLICQTTTVTAKPNERLLQTSETVETWYETILKTLHFKARHHGWIEKKITKYINIFSKLITVH